MNLRYKPDVLVLSSYFILCIKSGFLFLFLFAAGEGLLAGDAGLAGDVLVPLPRDAGLPEKEGDP